MKKFLLFAILALSNYSLFSQNQKDFINFATSFNWSMTESEFVTQYGNQILPESDSLYASLNIQKGSYVLTGLNVSDYTCQTLVTFSENDTPTVVAFITDESVTSSPAITSKKLDDIVHKRMNEPDLKLDNAPLSMFGYPELEGKNGEIKIWTTAEYTFGTVSVTIEEGLVYMLIGRKGETREPDFRKGTWGDSMASCKSKEGKLDEYGMDDIYAFDTYLAGLKAIAAYRFTNNKLTSGKYVFTNINEKDCIRNYEMLVSLLTKKYGDPINVTKDYKASEYEKNTYTDGELVERGKLELSSYWNNYYSLICITLRGEKYSISLNIEYYSNKLNEEREESILEDL